MEFPVQITQIINTSMFPIVVECVFYDAWGKEHFVQEKLSVLSTKNIITEEDLPCEGVIACELVKDWQDETGRNIITVTTLKPWGIETVNGVTEFDLLGNWQL